MRNIPSAVLVALAFFAAVACQNSPTGPRPVSASPTKSVSAGSDAGAKTSVDGLMGTWQATKAEGWRTVEEGDGFSEVVGSRRDLVAEGGTVTLVLEANRQRQALGRTIPDGLYTITVTMPGTKPGADTGYFYFGPAWQEKYKGLDQIDFYPSSLGPDPEYGWIPAFLVALSGSTLKLWDSGLTFLPFDFGWGTIPGMNGTSLSLEFTRK